MNTEDTYRPANIEFEVENTSRIVPNNLGVFETSQKAAEFIAKNLTGINYKISANRYMDNYEKTQIRKEYIDILENKLPLVKRDLAKAMQAFAEVKKAMENAKEFVSATSFEAESLALKVKNGVVDMKLDDQFTWRIPYEGKYYFFTYMDMQLKLCRVQDIPSFEMGDLYNAMNRNDIFFNEKLGVKDMPDDMPQSPEPGYVGHIIMESTAHPDPEYIPFEGGITKVDFEDDLPVVYNSDEDEEDPILPDEDDDHPIFRMED